MQRCKKGRQETRFTDFNIFLNRVCGQNKTNHTREEILKFVDQQKQSEKNDIGTFLNNTYNDDLSSLIEEYKKYLNESPEMNELETKLQAMITIFNSYEIVKNDALSWKKKYFSVLKILDCIWNFDNLKGVNNIKDLIDKFNKWYKEYKKIRHSKKREEGDRFDNIIRY